MAETSVGISLGPPKNMSRAAFFDRRKSGKVPEQFSMLCAHLFAGSTCTELIGPPKWHPGAISEPYCNHLGDNLGASFFVASETMCKRKAKRKTILLLPIWNSVLSSKARPKKGGTAVSGRNLSDPAQRLGGAGRSRRLPALQICNSRHRSYASMSLEI